MAKTSAKTRMLTALRSTTGRNTFTVAQARSRFGIKNVAQRIHDLRREGHTIATVEKTDSKGNNSYFYRMVVEKGTKSAKAASSKKKAS
mgnify:CR=1 FL=1